MTWGIKPELFDEHVSDATVIKSLLSHIKDSKRNLFMVLIDSKNNLYLVPDDTATLITEEMRTKLLADLVSDQELLARGTVAQPSQKSNIADQQIV